MRERLLKFMEIEKLQASRLAEILGVQPATISHILGGRNKPSFEFIEKMLLRFPKINPEWLLLGKGPVYRPEMIQPQISGAEQILPGNLFTADENPANELHDGTLKNQQSLNSGTAKAEPTAKATKPSDEPEIPGESPAKEMEIERIVILLKDGTCLSYKPRK